MLKVVEFEKMRSSGNLVHQTDSDDSEPELYQPCSGGLTFLLKFLPDYRFVLLSCHFYYRYIQNVHEYL